MKISIVMSYYNRRVLLIKTLESITNTHFDGEFEIIIVDDASTQLINDAPFMFTKFNIKIIQIPKKDKWWINPCIPNNIGFAAASGDVILIQNPECLHVGDVLKYIAENISINKYLVFSCYALDKTTNEKLAKVNGADIDGINKIIYPMNNVPLNQTKSMNRWYQHSKYSTRCYNFCTAITKKDLDELGGFDEEYARGLSCDDIEFLARIKKKAVDIKMIDSPFVVHQWHQYTDYSNKALVQKNRDLYYNKTLPGKNFYVDNKHTKELARKFR